MSDASRRGDGPPDGPRARLDLGAGKHARAGRGWLDAATSSRHSLRCLRITPFSALCATL